MTLLDEVAGPRTGQHELLTGYDLLGAVGDPLLAALARAAALATGAVAATVDVTGLTGPVVLASHLRPGAALRERHVVGTVPVALEGIDVGRLQVEDHGARALTAEERAALVGLAAVVAGLLSSRRDRRLAEDSRSDLAVVHELLVEMQAFDQALLDALPVGVLAVGPTGRWLRWNRDNLLWHGAGEATDLDAGSLAAHFRMYRTDGVTPFPPEALPLTVALQDGAASHTELVMRTTGEGARLVSCTGTPVQLADGTLLGAVLTMEDITARRAVEEQLREAALHDGLTGLPNRSLLADRLAHALRAGSRDRRRVAVLYGDLDGFKAVNDRFGHGAGDEVLVTAAERLAGALRPGDTVARIGGDEFVLLCPGVDTLDDAARIADRVTRAMESPVTTSAGVHRVGISVGFVLSRPGSTPETMLTAADEAMYRVKRTRHGPDRRR